ncbi:uncharacterized protein LOC116012037 isoform X1 [Ipomoea triloba]|uniref:uncharacterized protein LOC116012037 isoform X1 n=1 Tax=Ipomoea triloba TaxID=35885 RepID=UPI00125CE3D2|nr:uncharacterized protein LOC116012037 isoform X1 [Ipomoea triloba]XP_031107362.1 uncharacterized protein LOC116012037 isoform X1 [Ipomoea triloba]XP_031107363.1 uncharacterized protein LOC116012037 isoform X2 [Ipomoea triloba]XP_031107364.1 uncharacterized protein LOC116012037 isoform X1 [Ipomoea triloba]XP_031107365.1 uncharacterized protein LOC116012037 isoform X1 [Ipomoea triloba]
MDKAWMTQNKRSNEYIGLKNFMLFVGNHLGHDCEIRCPCKKCLNTTSLNQSVVYMHLRQNGIDTDYTQWIFHGESPTFQERSNNGSQVEYDDSDDDENLDGVDEFLNEYGNFVNFNSQLNPNTHSGEIDHFENMLREAKQELYPGCTKFSKLPLTVKLLHLKVYNKWSNKSFDMLLELLKECLPDGNTLPHSHYESKSMLCNLGLGYTNIHACKYDCVLFWKELETNECCPICGTSRWKVKGSKGKNIPHKILRYFPLKPRLQRLFMSKKIANDMRWHKERRIDDDEYLRHPADSKAWKDFDKEFPWFANDARNVRLGLASDGFNPFGNMSNAYSMWPVILIPYNLPPWMCMKESFFMLTLLIPGPKALGRDIDVYLQPLIDDLIELWEGGVTTYDSYSSTNFQLHASILWTINDFPAYGNLSGWFTKGYMACPNCNDDACSQRLRSKLGFLGSRRFLPTNHAWRRNKKFNGHVESRSATGKFK